MAEVRDPTIRVILLPKDTNPHGTIFGGVIMSHLDLAGAEEARKHTQDRVVTATIDKVEFIAPVFVGDVLSFYTRTVKIGRTSITVAVEVEAKRVGGGETVRVTEAEAIFVAVDDRGRPTPVRKGGTA